MNRKKTKRLRAIHYNAGNLLEYRRALLALIRAMNTAVKKHIVAIFKQAPLAMDANPVSRLRADCDSLAQHWLKRFSEEAEPLAEALVKKTGEAVDRALLAAARQAAITISLPWTEELLQKQQAIIAENVALIRSIPEKYFTEVEGMVYRAVARGGDRKSLVDEIVDQFGERHAITRRRAEFIARDQTRKATSALSAARQQAAGIVEGEWVHSGGGNQPRKSHVKAGKARQRFKLSAGCLIDGEHIMPGQLPNCGCVWKPILSF